ncbi:K+ channel tetramerization domain-containing protein [Toxoplasma gondii TgCatPRC2]|uniref:K+ channel tetramerisation domain-containing protein n=6 Tax=Toxoplasma gondii TaxID=5811 RepID=A0A125YN79_TOXGV|nr:K+ channel tetramerisation domain-containing protein [Toxoplasma gondii ME49]ESS31473.1 K+ channel tetramerisation domain-containing protein [Toxoplasma gondii VEG]KFH14902.1 K+ channel tetramerization domain-containing protein [Toxoplasma gondii MAS]KYF39845.1 K+ channel tetramerization domain-containing protein [Toxoplasma gondii ARI]KYK66024.1 K+ channel tetramerization domain-containing protein [Toxoplasma gondii TgCatPRC2]PIM02586.1 K+ channel tetramerization domain-containing protein |eukprot:XP_018637598.1 K+ channel tetramerisation domain-containing protein [Toxoplasma gondii ME49]
MVKACVIPSASSPASLLLLRSSPMLCASSLDPPTDPRSPQGSLPRIGAQSATGASRGQSADRVVLNVGGKIHETTAETLLSVPDSYFTALLSSGWRDSSPGSRDHGTEDKPIFVDRNGERFTYVLDFLRDGVLLCPREKILLQCLRLEAKFFALEPLLVEVERELEQIELENAARALRIVAARDKSLGGAAQSSSGAESSPSSGFSPVYSPLRSRRIPGDGVSEPSSPSGRPAFVPCSPGMAGSPPTSPLIRPPNDFMPLDSSLRSPACSRVSSPTAKRSFRSYSPSENPDRSEEAQRRALINDDPEPPPILGLADISGDARLCLGDKIFRTDADF